VVLCTPPYLHAGQIQRCLSSGVWVLCEKPICGSLAELDAIEAAETLNNARCSSVFQWRFGERVERFKRLIGAQAFGRALLASCATTWYRDQAYYEVPWRGAWATELGGPTVGAGIHFMDLVLWLLGDWEEVVALVGTLDRDIELEDVSIAGARLASGAMLSIVNSVLSPRQETALRFDFSKATVELHCLYSYLDQDWTLTPLPGAEVPDDVWEPPSPPADRHALQLAELLDAMDGRRELSPSVADIRPTYDLITSMYKAAATKEAVQRGSIVPGDPFYEHFGGTLLLPFDKAGRRQQPV
jgi:predicted dehydrogenase